MSDILIIKGKWLNKIFHTGKILEIRGSNTKKRGFIQLAESGTSQIKGYCRLYDSFPIRTKEEWEQLKPLHQVDISWDELLKRYKSPHAWKLQDAKEYESSKPYKHPKGAVIWVNYSSPTANALEVGACNCLVV